MILVPENSSVERIQTMKPSNLMFCSRPIYVGWGRVLYQFGNTNMPLVHYETAGPEIREQSQGQITRVVSAMGTIGTITGVSRYINDVSPGIRIIGVQPEEGFRIPDIRKWPDAYCLSSFRPEAVDELINVHQADAEEMARRLAMQ